MAAQVRTQLYHGPSMMLYWERVAARPQEDLLNTRSERVPAVYQVGESTGRARRERGPIPRAGENLCDLSE
jgi:hypothetical protein